MLTREEVILGFRMILEREPESERTIELQRRHPSLEEFARTLRNSDEFRTHAARERLAGTALQHWVRCDLPSGLCLWVNLLDEGVSWGILRGSWEPAETNFMISVLQPGDAIIDIGANVGWFTVILAQALGPNGHVFAFEPRSDIFARLERSVRENGFSERCTLHELALGAEAGERSIGWFPAEKNDGHSFFTPAGTPPSADMRNETVRVAPLDDLGIERRIRLIKLDVEGAEVDVLRGGRNLIARDRPIIVSEAFPKWLRRSGNTDAYAFLHALDDLGYRAHYLTDDGIGGEVHWPVTDLDSEVAIYSVIFLGVADRVALLDGKRDARVQELQARLAEASHANDRLRRKLSASESRGLEAERYKEEAEQAAARNATLTAEIERLTRELAEANSRVQGLEQRARAAEWRDLEAARRSLRLGGIDQEHRAQPMAEQLATAQTLAKQLRTEIEAMRRSTSWRLTAPIRVARRVFGGSRKNES